MDTNLLTALQLLTAANQRAPDNTLLIVSMIISAVAPTLAAVAAYLKANSTNAEVAKIHIAVNSERSAMIAEVKSLRDEILTLNKAKSTLEETQRGRNFADSVKQGKAEMVAELSK